MVIGLIGHIGSGKTEAGLILRSMISGSEIVPFAKPLKNLAKSIGWNGEKDEKGRRLLQLLGTDVLRECIDPEWHTKAWGHLVTHIQGAGNPNATIIVDDVRFVNEVKMIHHMGGSIIRITGRRYGLPTNWLTDLRYKTKKKHESETALDHLVPRFTIDNQYSKSSLREDLDQIRRELLR